MWKRLTSWHRSPIVCLFQLLFFDPVPDAGRSTTLRSHLRTELEMQQEALQSFNKTVETWRAQGSPTCLSFGDEDDYDEEIRHYVREACDIIDLVTQNTRYQLGELTGAKLVTTKKAIEELLSIMVRSWDNGRLPQTGRRIPELDR